MSIVLEVLILAYRNSIFDWTWEKIFQLIKSNKKRFLFGIVLIVASIATVIYAALNKAPFLLMIFFTGELVIIVTLDRKMVREYQQYISAKQDHLGKVVELLQSSFPEHNLFTKNHIEALIDRLNINIKMNAPFSKAKAKIENLGTTLILPIATCMIGAYATSIAQTDPIITISYAVALLLAGLIIYISFIPFFEALKALLCRDYDAMVALRSDLLDIEFLYFCDD